MSEEPSRRDKIGCIGIFVGIWVLGLFIKPFDYSKPWNVPASLVAAFFGWVAARYLAPFLSSEIKLQDQIDARKKEAVRKQFASKAGLIIDAFGQDKRYLDQNLDITANRPDRRKEATLIKYNRGGEWRLVFESLFSPKEEHEHKEGVYIVPQTDGSSKVEEKWSFSTPPESLEILAYVPGEWETHLDSLASLAEKKRNDMVHRNDVLTRKQALDEQKIRFGLD